MQNLAASGLDQALREVMQSGKPVLAICVGMQALLCESEEFGRTPGLGIFEDKSAVSCYPVSLGNASESAAHGLEPVAAATRLSPPAGIPDGAFAYFVHSYYAAPQDTDVVVATTDYGVEFASMLWRDNLYATQFPHPEKSQHWGLRILRNFLP
jgi:glutamine amidotransferase